MPTARSRAGDELPRTLRDQLRANRLARRGRDAFSIMDGDGARRHLDTWRCAQMRQHSRSSRARTDRRDARQMREERSADAAATKCGLQKDVFDIETGLCAERRVGPYQMQTPAASPSQSASLVCTFAYAPKYRRATALGVMLTNLGPDELFVDREFVQRRKDKMGVADLRAPDGQRQTDTSALMCGCA